MMKKTYWYPTAFSHWGDEELDAIEAVTRSCQFTMGPRVEAFEEELARFNKRKHAVMVNSGSSANLIAVAALCIESKFPVLMTASVPALAWATTYAPLFQHGFDFLLRDCDDSWCANEFPASRKIINLSVCCSILGNPADGMALDACDLNDDCEALGATIEGQPTGSFGRIATQSFFWSHQLSAIEGGACLTDDDTLARNMRMLRDHGLTRSVVQKHLSFDTEYDFRCFGYNVRPLEMHAAIASQQLLKLNMHKAARRRNYARFELLVRDLPVKMPTVGEGFSPFSIHFELPSHDKRNQVVAALRANDIDCRMPTGGSFRLHAYGAPWRSQLTERADTIHNRGMFIGNAPYDIEEKVTKATQVIRQVLS